MTKQMWAAIRTKPGEPLAVTKWPRPREGELVKVLACGVCHTDLHVVDGDLGPAGSIVPGHEIVGDHAELGRVLVFAAWGCRRDDCEQCSSGMEMVCPNSREAGVQRDGGYAEYVSVPSRDYLIPIGDADPASIAPMACSGLTSFRAVRRVAGPLTERENSRAAVIGVGGLGQLAVQFLRQLTPAQVTAVDTSEARLSDALSVGAHSAVRPEALAGQFDVVIDFVGSDETLVVARDHVRRQGMVVVVGLFGGRIQFGLGAVPSEATFTTSIWGSLADLRDLLAHIKDHPVQQSIERFPLSEVGRAHARLRAGQISGRAVLDVGV